MTTLPIEFLSRMKELLGEEYEDFMKSYEEPRQYGLRVNTLKLTTKEWDDLAPFPIEPIPWTTNGYFYPGDVRPARHPFYQAGLYYLQEPSAMTPAARLPIEPGEYVLDLCAAPGGKATELGARLKGQGLLVANDISTSRARALLRNLELFGISNGFVTNEIPARLTRAFPEFFDKILLDAPCSGEGMFRKEPEVASAWYPERPEELSKIQRDLIGQAIRMLRPGGLLLYSTCTFAPIENEGTISYVLEEFPEMELLDMEGCTPGNASEGPSRSSSIQEEKGGFSPGVPAWGNGDERLKKCVRIWPHRMDGEGHFLCLLKKPGERLPRKEAMVQTKLEKNASKLLREFFGKVKKEFPFTRMEVRGEKVYLLPDACYSVKGIKFLRNGCYLGDLKKNRFEPSQQLAMMLQGDDWDSVLRLDTQDERIDRYLRGETLNLTQEETTQCQGWTLVCVDNYALGWGKAVGSILKNKYAQGWRK